MLRVEIPAGEVVELSLLDDAGKVLGTVRVGSKLAQSGVAVRLTNSKTFSDPLPLAKLQKAAAFFTDDEPESE